LCTSDPRWDRGIKESNRLFGYDVNTTIFLILLELRVDSSMFDFLVQCLLTDLVQDIVVSQFDSSAFIKACIVGVSV